MHKAKWGSVDAMVKKELVVDSHMYSAPVGTIRTNARGADGKRQVLFWRTKTRCSSVAEWMELHDAATGAVLWRAEARYADRAAPVVTHDAAGQERTEFLTVVRMYLETETTPRLMIVHRDRQPGGLKSADCAKTLAVYMLDPNAGYKPPTPTAAVAGAGGASNEADHASSSPQQLLEHFDFAPPPAGEDVFQLALNPTMTTISLAALRLPDSDSRRVSHTDVRTLARLKVVSPNSKRRLDIDGGLDVHLVTMLLCATDQLLLSHEAIDYDVEWPEDYGFAYGECFSARKKEAEELKKTAEFGMGTSDLGGGELLRENRSDRSSCLGFCF